MCASEAKAEVLAGLGYAGMLNAFVWLVKIPMLEQLHESAKKIVFEKDLEGAEFARTLIMTTIDDAHIRSLWPHLDRNPRWVVGIDIGKTSDASAVAVYVADQMREALHLDEIKEVKSTSAQAIKALVSNAWPEDRVKKPVDFKAALQKGLDAAKQVENYEEQEQRLVHVCYGDDTCGHGCPAFAPWFRKHLMTAAGSRLDWLGEMFVLDRSKDSDGTDPGFRRAIDRAITNFSTELACNHPDGRPRIVQGYITRWDEATKKRIKGKWWKLDGPGALAPEHDERETVMKRIARTRGVVEARYESTCHICNKLIVPGNRIAMGALASWVHELCSAA